MILGFGQDLKRSCDNFSDNLGVFLLVLSRSGL